MRTNAQRRHHDHVYIMLFNNVGVDAVKCIQNSVTQGMTGSDYIHCEIFFPGNRAVFMITPKTHVVKKLSSREFTRTGYEFWRLNVTQDQYLAMWDFCTSMIGTPYDSTNYMCMPLYLLINTLTCRAIETCLPSDANKTNCSRLVISAMRAARFVSAMNCNPSVATPAMVHSIIIREGATLDLEPDCITLGVQEFKTYDEQTKDAFSKTRKKPGLIVTQDMYGERP